MRNNHRIILKTISVILLFEGTAMLLPVICAVHYNERGPASAFFFTAICCICFGLTTFRHLKYHTMSIKHREGFFVAFICWIVVCLIGTIPYAMSECGYSYADCLFESISGWTTTGAWVINIDTMPRSLILWKAITNWLGGMGLILLTISFFPILGVQGQKMAAAEMPGPHLEKMSARIGDTAKLSYKIYIAMTVLELCLLLPSGLTSFEALINTMSTISTAGVLNLNNDVIINSTPYVKGVITLFSICGSINFMMYYFISAGKWKRVLKSVELRTYIGLLSGSALLMAIVLRVAGTYSSFVGALGDSFVQAVSYGSTSGFMISNINLWPTTCKIILLMLLFIGGCANSTSGSIKVIRAVVYFKLIMRGIYKRIHPHAIKPIMIQKKPVSAESASSITVFLLLYFAFYIFSCLVLSLENQDLETTLAAALGAISNNGSSFGAVVNGGYNIFSAPGKIFSAILMLAGRLELYAIILLFSRSFWNPDRARS